MPGSRHWNVDFDEGAVRDFEAVKAKGERRAVFNVVDKLRQLGPRLVPPHVKSLAGETNIFELRPRQGNSKPRPLVVRRGDGYLVVAVAAITRATCAGRPMMRAIGSRHAAPLPSDYP